MSGRSGSAVAPHTPIIKVGEAHFAISSAQMRLVRRMLERRGRCGYVVGAEVRSAKKLVALGVATLTDDGPGGDKKNFVGERWTFILSDTVSVPS